MEKIILYKIRAQKMNQEKFNEIANYLEMKGEIQENDEAFTINLVKQALIYAQPCSKFAGILFYTDQTKGMAEIIEKVIDAEEAKS
jgi:hypothetical protein